MISRVRFEQLYRECERPFFNIALRWTWNRTDALEIVQETFLRVWTRRLGVSEARAAAYAHRCLLNLCHDRARRTCGLNEALDHEPRDPDSKTADEELFLHEIRTALEQLPRIQRDVILLTEFGGLKHREIAKILNIAPGTVGSRRNAAIEQLRRKLT